MTDYADELLSGNISKPQKKRDWADELLGLAPVKDPHAPGKEALMQTGEEPTGAIDTRTTEPIMRPVDYESTRPGFGALVETGFVDNPETQMDILSKRMGIPRERFGIVNGEIVYRGDDNILYPAMPSKFEKGIAQEVARTPSLAMGAIGAIGGPGTAAIGAAGGEGIRRSVGKLIYDEPQTSLGNVGKMAKEGAFAYVGEKVGGKLIGAVDRTRGKQASTLMKLAGTERGRINPKVVEEIEMLGQKYGIDLFTPQTTGSHELIARFSLLGDLPVTADKIGAARMRQYGQINKAVNEWLDTLAAKTTTPGESGRRAVEAARAAMKAPKEAARKASKAFYDEARQAAGVDISDTIKGIDSMLQQAPKGGVESKALTRIRGMLTRKVRDENGLEMIVPEDRVSVLDKVKREINSMWKKDPKTSPDIDAQRSINETLEGMLAQIDEQVPVYGQARKAYRESIQESGFEELGKTKIGQLAKMEGDKVETAAKYVFSPSQSSPEIISINKKEIVKHGGEEAWNALLRTHLKNKFREVVKTNTENIGGMLRKKLWTDIDQKEILQAAMSEPQLENFENFMKVLERTGLTAGKESTTAPRLVSQAQMADEAAGLGGKMMRAVAYPLYTWKRIVADFRLKMKTEAYQTLLADAMLNPDNSRLFRSMLQLQPGSQKAIKTLSTFLTSLSGGTYLRERAKYEGSPPATLIETRPPQRLTPRLTR